MCLILLAWQAHPQYPLILAANRDEFYDRPTAAADFWEERPDILGGRDLRDGGTWLGVTRRGRWAALTNYRDPQAVRAGAPSRGWLVRNFLEGSDSPAAYLERLAPRVREYNPFNLFAGDAESLHIVSSQGSSGPVPPGVHGLSNAVLDTPWPKVRRGREAFRRLLERHSEPDPDALFQCLADMERAPDGDLPETGIGQDWERILSPLFITSPVYGTRSSTVLMVNRRGRVTFIERSFQDSPEPWMTARFEFSREGSP